MDDNLLRPNQFALKIGRTRQAVSLAINDSGVLPTTEIDGIKYVDLNNPHVKAYMDSAKTDGKTGRSSRTKKREKSKPGHGSGRHSRKKNKGKLKSVAKEDEIPDELKRIADSHQLTPAMLMDMPKAHVDKIKIYEQIKSIRQAREEKRRQLISRRLIRVVFGKIYEIDVNEFLTIKSKVVPDLAGLFGCTDSEKMLTAEKRIDEELWKILKHIKIELDKFLVKIDDEPINESPRRAQ